MSTSRTDYVVVGVNVPCELFPEETYEQYEAYNDNNYKAEPTTHNDLTMIYDGMFDEYCIIGKVIDKALEDHGHGLDVIDCGLCIKKYKSIVTKNIAKYFPQLQEYKVSVYAFTHWH